MSFLRQGPQARQAYADGHATRRLHDDESCLLTLMATGWSRPDINA